MDADKLKGKIKEKGFTQAAVASGIGLSLSRFNAKVNGTGGADFTLGEVRAMKSFLSLTGEELDFIFLS